MWQEQWNEKADDKEATPNDKSSSRRQIFYLMRMDKAQGNKFIEQVFEEARDYGGIEFREILPNLKAHIEETGERPSPSEVVERACAAALDKIEGRRVVISTTKSQSVTPSGICKVKGSQAKKAECPDVDSRMRKKKSERKHKSVWEIRN